ncbi:fumarylacetoacetate hydrolase family protein [Ottowia thiooxydans]|uniref:fumarylacetoacetate hydrolase family protein n=1 Tax=Ottowia thiooxydans TaxID=219182 RepID=UPI000409E2DD|nr:fumarylacetoacetate hydrolase family protein [Ottowia thiooxydans]
MKLATYKDGSRNGQLLVVSHDLQSAHYATGIASSLQQVLDDWNFFSPQLQDLSHALNTGRSRHAFAFDPRQCMAPLPRAYQWLSSSAYLSHVELEHASRGTELPGGHLTEPLMYQGGSDHLLGPCDAIVGMREEWGIDFGAGIAVITGDVPMGCTEENSLDAVRLVMLANDVSLRVVISHELPKGFGYLRGKPATAFSPVAVTPDELGDAWQEGRVHLTLQSTWNGRKIGLCETGPEMHFHFGQLIAHAAKTRPLGAGSIIGSGAVSNQGAEEDGRRDWPKGYGSIAEKRAMEFLQNGAPKTDYLKAGDTIRMEIKGKNGHSVFGAIEQEVKGFE